MLKYINVLLLSLVFASFAGAAPNKVLKALSNKYQASPLVEMNVEKTVTSELLGKTTRHSGKIKMAKGKFRWENSVPEETLLVFDGSIIWSVQYPPKEFGGNPQVLRGKVDKKNRKQILISSLMGADIEKGFKVVSESETKGIADIVVSPRSDDILVKTLHLLINVKKSELQEISYRDDLGNETKLAFSEIKFLKKVNNNIFKYQPPKNAQVSDL